MVLLNFNKFRNIIIDSQYSESVVLHIKSTELIPGNSKLTLLFVQLDLQSKKGIYHFILPMFALILGCLGH